MKDTIIDALKASLKGVTVLTSAVGHVEDEYSNEYIPNHPGRIPIPSTSKDGSLSERVASLKQLMVKIITFVREEKLTKKKKKEKNIDKFIYLLIV